MARKIIPPRVNRPDPIDLPVDDTLRGMLNDWVQKQKDNPPLGSTPKDLLSGADADLPYTAHHWGEDGSYQSDNTYGSFQDIINSLSQQWQDGHGKPVWNTPRTENWNFTVQQYFAFLQEMWNRQNSDLAWQRQRYSEDLAYDRTKFETLFNQYLSAGMSPAAALQAASGGSPDVSGSSPAPGAGGSAAGGASTTPFTGVSDLVGGLGSLVGHAIDASVNYSRLKEQKREYDSSLYQRQYEFDVQNFDAVQAFKGSNDFYSQTAPLFFTRGKVSNLLPFEFLDDSHLSPHEILPSLSAHKDDFPELIQSIIDNESNPYYQASMRDFMRSQLGIRAYTANQRNLKLQNDFLQDKIISQDIANRVANLSLAEYNSAIYGYLNYVVETDSAFRDSYGIYHNGSDWVIPYIERNDGTIESDVRLTDYIGYMEKGYISNMSLQGLSYLDILSFTAQYQALTLQTDLSLYQRNKNILLNDAKSREFLSALDAFTNQEVSNFIHDSPTLENLIRFRGAMDRTGVTSATKWAAEQGIKLYGIRSGNKNAAAARAQQQDFFDQNLQQRQHEFDNRGFSEDSWFDESTKMHHKVRR